MTIDLKKHRIALTGSAGFIGFHVAKTLLDQGVEVWSFDSVNDYYSVDLKEDRLKILAGYKHHHFRKGFLESKKDVAALFADSKPDIVVNLAAQAGVRHSLMHPHDYVDGNVTGFLNILEESRKANIKHLVYASTSSVYGGNAKTPFSEDDSTDHPSSLYAATKKANEAMAHNYSHLFDLPTTGLRFFTVYGPWGRPDMAMYKFANAIARNEPIDVYNNGDMRRDFTYIDDIVAGIIGAIKNIPAVDSAWDAVKANSATSSAPWRVYNLGNNSASNLMDVIKLIEKAMGREAEKNYMPMQLGDVLVTYANIDRARRDLGFNPKTNIEEGVKKFVEWYKDYHA